ncbi:WD40 repeat domain-containing protein, partial [Crateriforma spongiae]|uniref:hypothetical protein n=1 Tax=Crateriforma spongiae TaxID=2724528 RepID=UPI0019814B50
CEMKTLYTILLIAAAFFGTCGCQDANREEKFTPWSDSKSAIYQLTFSPNDDLFAVLTEPLSEDENVRLRVVDRKLGRTIVDTNGMAICSPCFDKRSKLFAVFIGTSLVVYDLNTGETVLKIDRMDIFDGKTAAMGFSRDGDILILDKLSAFGFEETPPDRLAIAIASGERINTSETPAIWYGKNLAPDGTKWFGGGWPGPTPRVFHRNGNYIGFCYREPNISRAWFSRDSNSLLTLHSDGALVKWNLNSENDSDELNPVSIADCPDLLESKIVTPLHTQDSFAIVDAAGHMSARKLPVGIRRTKP